VPVAVIAELAVEEGDSVKEGQVIARLDRYRLQQAIVREREALLTQAEAELRRAKDLASGNVGAVSRREDTEATVRAGRAALDAARAELELALVRAPIAGRVLDRAGERVGPDGIVELGRTDEMFAVAEVYETDIGRVRTGQRAVVTSPALAAPQQGSVERIGLKIGRLDAVGADPIAKTDARVVEVEIRLDEPKAVAHLTNLQVEIEIAP
jgi:HlyD family secretion protein